MRIDTKIFIDWICRLKILCIFAATNNNVCHNVKYLFSLMVSIIDNSTRFDFDLTEIASIFGITLDKEHDELENCVLVLAPVLALLRDMVLRNHYIPHALWDVVLTLANTIESLTYPEHEG